MKNQHVPVKPYSMKELAILYEVSPRTLRRWMIKIKPAIGERIGHYYMITQVSIIFDKLGVPRPDHFK